MNQVTGILALSLFVQEKNTGNWNIRINFVPEQRNKVSKYSETLKLYFQ